MTTDPGDPIDIEAHLADDQHRGALDRIPRGFLDLSDIDRARTTVARLTAGMDLPPIPDAVTVTDHRAPGHAGGPDVTVRTYRPDNATTAAPALYWIHGGGMVLGSVDQDDALCAGRALHLGCVVASVEYRLAPEHPFPAPLDDCYAGLAWFAGSATDLGVDRARIAIGGASAGGGLAAGLAIMARDLGGPDICFQLLVYPMLDHRNTTATSRRILDDRVWNRPANVAGWAAYLGDLDADEVPPRASPSVATDLSGLPAAYVNVGGLDLFHDEDVAYATALAHAGVAVELHTYPGAFHGSSMLVPDSPLTHRWHADELAALERAFS